MSQFFLSRCVISSALILALFGCGADKETNSTSTPPKEVFPVVALDGFSIAVPGALTFIDLSPQIRGGKATVDSVHYTGTDVESCQPPILRGIGFDVMSSSGALCDYQFTVGNEESTDTASMTVLFTKAVNPIIPPLSHAMLLNGGNVEFNLPALLGSDWPTDYSLNTAVVTVQGSENNTGLATASSTSLDTIIYTPPSWSGWNRIVYTLTNAAKPTENIMGTIYVTISDKINQPPIINELKYDFNSKVNAGTPEELGCKFYNSEMVCAKETIIKMFENKNSVIIISTPPPSDNFIGLIKFQTPDLSASGSGKILVINNQIGTDTIRVNIDGEPSVFVRRGDTKSFRNKSDAKWIQLGVNYDPNALTGKSIDIDLSLIVTDPDSGEDWQVVEAQSYTATVLLKKPNSITNKIISFSAATAGKHIISYVVADHYGGYSMGLIEVQVTVEDISANWNETLTADSRDYTPPLRYIDGIESGFSVTALWDDGVKNTISGYSLNVAQKYCDTKGRIPTESEMNKLISYNTDKVNIWPKANRYWVLKDAGDGYLAYDIGTGLTSPIVSAEYYVTCINSKLVIKMLASSTTVIASDPAVSQAVEIAKITKLPGTTLRIDRVDTGRENDLEHFLPIGSPPVFALVDNSDTQMTVTTQSIKSGVSQFKVTSKDGDAISSPIITYISDITTARLSSLNVDVNNATANGTAENKLTAMITDINGNPEIGQTITLRLVELGASPNSARLITPASGLVTDTNGQVSFSVRNTEAEQVEVTAAFKAPEASTVPDSSLIATITFNSVVP